MRELREQVEALRELLAQAPLPLQAKWLNDLREVSRWLHKLSEDLPSASAAAPRRQESVVGLPFRALALTEERAYVLDEHGLVWWRPRASSSSSVAWREFLQKPEAPILPPPPFASIAPSGNLVMGMDAMGRLFWPDEQRRYWRQV